MLVKATCQGQIVLVDIFAVQKPEVSRRADEAAEQSRIAGIKDKDSTQTRGRKAPKLRRIRIRLVGGPIGHGSISKTEIDEAGETSSRCYLKLHRSESR